MAVEYGKYADIDEGALSSDAANLKAKLSSARSELNSFKGTLTDDIWKAGAKQTLFDAFVKLDGDVYANLDGDLGKISSIAAEISNYKAAEAEAKKQQGYIDTAKAGRTAALNNNPDADVSSYDNQIQRATRAKETYEEKMQKAIDNINALNS